MHSKEMQGIKYIVKAREIFPCVVPSNNFPSTSGIMKSGTYSFFSLPPQLLEPLHPFLKSVTPDLGARPYILPFFKTHSQ